MEQISNQRIIEKLKQIEDAMVTKQELKQALETIAILSNEETMKQIYKSESDIMSINRKPNSKELGGSKRDGFRFWSILKNFLVKEKSPIKLYPLGWSRRFFRKFFLIQKNFKEVSSAEDL